MNKHHFLMIVLLGFCVVSLVIYNISKESRKRAQEEVGPYRIEKITVNEERKEIEFPGVVNRNAGWVQCLLYAHSYRWLRDESAIVGNISLLDLQKALLSLGFKYWKPIRSPGKLIPCGEEVVDVLIKWDEEEKERAINILSAIADDQVRESLTLEQIIFLGMGANIFDEKALREPLFVDCSRDKLFLPLEKKMIRDWFLRPSGQSGYEIRSDIFPDRGTEVTIIMRIVP